MSKKMKEIALIYDFDCTLIPGCSQEYSLASTLGFESAEMWNSANIFRRKYNIDDLLGFNCWILKMAKEKNIKITRKFLESQGKNIKFFNGVEEWFERINNYGKKLGLIISHYIISSGNLEIMQGCNIAKYFKKIFACEFAYDDNGEAFFVARTVDYTGKTQYLYRIKKNLIDDLYDNKSINRHIKATSGPKKFKNMIYIGDGETDVPCMQIVKDNGGYSVSVYHNDKSIETSKILKKEKRVHLITEADYSENGKLDKSIKARLLLLSKFSL